MTTTTAPKGTARPRSDLFWALSDSIVLIGRNVRHVLRSPEQLMLMLFLPNALQHVPCHADTGLRRVEDDADPEYRTFPGKRGPQSPRPAAQRVGGRTFPGKRGGAGLVRFRGVGARRPPAGRR
jgi:hypothetical protein